jgi:hypothetical protein
MGAGKEVHELEVELDARLGSEQHDRTAGGGYGVVVELQGVLRWLRLPDSHVGIFAGHVNV